MTVALLDRQGDASPRAQRCHKEKIGLHLSPEYSLHVPPPEKRVSNAHEYKMSEISRYFTTFLCQKRVSYCCLFFPYFGKCRDCRQRSSERRHNLKANSNSPFFGFENTLMTFFFRKKSTLESKFASGRTRHCNTRHVHIHFHR